MINKPAIIGCGTVGASLSFGLAQTKAVSDLKLYDFDTVSEFNNKPAYPFLAEEYGIPKVQIVKFHCRCLNPQIRILIYREKVVEPLTSRSFVIDCRDNKSTDIGANVRISLDGHMLYLDSMSYENSEFDYHRYITPRCPDYIDKAINIIISYLMKDEYIYRDFRFYDLRTEEHHILNKEDFYGGSPRPSNSKSR
jgi:hypothetical protein